MDPVFIVGLGRSGTTLLSVMLDAHSRIAIPYESHFFIKYWRNVHKFGDLSNMKNRVFLVESILAEPFVAEWDRKPTLDEIDLEQCIDLPATISQIYCVYARKHGKPCWGDKTPTYIAHIDILNKMFPEAKIVHIYRDGRDVALSPINLGWWSYPDFVSHLRGWRDTIYQARASLRKLPHDQWIEIKYEDLVSSPEKEMRRLASFLGIEFEANMLDGYLDTVGEKVGSRINQHHANLRSKPSPKHAFKWKKTLSPADQAIAYQIAGALFKELEYPEGNKSHCLAPIRRMYHFGDRVRRYLHCKVYTALTGREAGGLFKTQR